MRKSRCRCGKVMVSKDTGHMRKRCPSCALRRKRLQSREYKRLLRRDPVRWEAEKRKGREWRRVKYAEARAVGDALLDDVIRHPRRYLSKIRKGLNRRSPAKRILS